MSDGEFGSIFTEMECYQAAKRDIRLKTRKAVETNLVVVNKTAIEEGHHLGIQEAKKHLFSGDTTAGEGLCPWGLGGLREA